MNYIAASIPSGPLCASLHWELPSHSYQKLSNQLLSKEISQVRPGQAKSKVRSSILWYDNVQHQKDCGARSALSYSEAGQFFRRGRMSHITTIQGVSCCCILWQHRSPRYAAQVCMTSGYGGQSNDRKADPTPWARWKRLLPHYCMQEKTLSNTLMLMSLPSHARSWSRLHGSSLYKSYWLCLETDNMWAPLLDCTT